MSRELGKDKLGSVQELLNIVAHLCCHQPESLRGVEEVMESLWPFLREHPRYARQSLLKRLVEPERIVIFRACWIDAGEEVQVNRGYRIQHSSAIGPYKGGLRFRPSVNLSILEFLAFAQTFKNALTTLPLGRAMGGTDFDPRASVIWRSCAAVRRSWPSCSGTSARIPTCLPGTSAWAGVRSANCPA